MADDPEPEDAIESQRLQAEFEQSCLDYGEAIKEGRHEDAEEIAMKVMQLSILRSMTEEPSPTLAWMQMASECEEQGNWAAAIDAHQHAIAAARAEANPAFAMKPHLDLAGLYDILGRGPEAMSQIDAAVELVKDNEIASLRAMAFEAKAKALLSSGDKTAAKELIVSLLATIPDEPLHALLLARILVLRARCEAAVGQLEAAEETLKQAKRRTASYSDSGFLGGLQAYFAQAADVSASIFAARGLKAEAAAAYGEAIARIRIIVDQPHLQGIRTRYRLARSLKAHARYLAEAGKNSEASEARQESESLFRSLQLPAA